MYTYIESILQWVGVLEQFTEVLKFIAKKFNNLRVFFALLKSYFFIHYVKKHKFLFIIALKFVPTTYILCNKWLVIVITTRKLVLFQSLGYNSLFFSGWFITKLLETDFCLQYEAMIHIIFNNHLLEDSKEKLYHSKKQKL